MAELFPGLADLAPTDLSVQVLTALLGRGWNELSSLSQPGSDAVMDNLLFTLFNVLNCCCAIVVAWLFILTTLSATLGAAQDGQGIAGRRYSSAWIPLRYSFAMGAITPVFSGLNAMQVLMLSCISLSVQFADTMWQQGLEHISATGSVLSRSQPVVAASAGQVLPVLMEHHVLQKYFRESECCAMASDSRRYEADWSQNSYVIRFELPPVLNCPNLRGDDGSGLTLNPSLSFGDLGAITVSTPVQAASEALARVLRPGGSLYEAAGRSVEAALQAPDEDRFRAADMAALARLYQDSVSAALKSASTQVLEEKRELLTSFGEQAATGGWWMAGSYYWTLAKMAADSVEAMQDRTTAQPVNLQALSDFMNPDLERMLKLARELGSRAGSLASEGSGTVNPVTGSTLVAGSGEREEAVDHNDGSVTTLLAGFFSGASHAISEFALDEADVGSSLIAGLGGHDLVFNVVKAARTLMNVCENCVISYMSLKLFAHSLGVLVKNPVTGGIAGAAEGVLDLVGKVALAIAAPLWLVCWFYAYMLPMLPFLAWFVAIIGWLVLCLEAVAACPLWLVAHCMPEGDGFAGLSARAGYALFLSVLLRPLLLVLAFFMCMIVLSVSGSFMGTLLVPFFDVQGGAFATGGFGTSGFGITASISTVLLVGLVCGIGTWKLFTLITVIPDRIIRWAGQLVASLGDFNAERSLQQDRATMDSTAARLIPSVAAGSAIGAIANAGPRRTASAYHAAPRSGSGPDSQLDQALAQGTRGDTRTGSDQG